MSSKCVLALTWSFGYHEVMTKHLSKGYSGTKKRFWCAFTEEKDTDHTVGLLFIWSLEKIKFPLFGFIIALARLFFSLKEEIQAYSSARIFKHISAFMSVLIDKLNGKDNIMTFNLSRRLEAKSWLLWHVC